eukprot:3569647-Amphidinium_carterae.1
MKNTPSVRAGVQVFGKWKWVLSALLFAKLVAFESQGWPPPLDPLRASAQHEVPLAADGTCML